MPGIWTSEMNISGLKFSTFPKAYLPDLVISTAPEPAKSATISWQIIFSSSTTSTFYKDYSFVTKQLLKIQ